MKAAALVLALGLGLSGVDAACFFSVGTLNGVSAGDTTGCADATTATATFSTGGASGQGVITMALTQAAIKTGSSITGTGIGLGATVTVVNGAAITVSPVLTAQAAGTYTISSLYLGNGASCSYALDAGYEFGEGKATFSTGGASGASTMTMSAGVTGFVDKMAISGTGIAAGTTIVSTTGSVITLSKALTAQAAGDYAITHVLTQSCSASISTATRGVASTATDTALLLATGASQALTNKGTPILVGSTVTATGIAANSLVTVISVDTLTLSNSKTAAAPATADAISFQFKATATGGASGGSDITFTTADAATGHPAMLAGVVGYTIAGTGVPAHALVASIAGQVVTIVGKNGVAVTLSATATGVYTFAPNSLKDSNGAASTIADATGCKIGYYQSAGASAANGVCLPCAGVAPASFGAFSAVVGNSCSCPAGTASTAGTCKSGCPANYVQTAGTTAATVVCTACDMTKRIGFAARALLGAALTVDSDAGCGTAGCGTNYKQTGGSSTVSAACVETPVSVATCLPVLPMDAQRCFTAGIGGSAGANCLAPLKKKADGTDDGVIKACAFTAAGTRASGYAAPTCSTATVAGCLAGCDFTAAVTASALVCAACPAGKLLATAVLGPAATSCNACNPYVPGECASGCPVGFWQSAGTSATVGAVTCTACAAGKSVTNTKVNDAVQTAAACTAAAAAAAAASSATSASVSVATAVAAALAAAAILV